MRIYLQAPEETGKRPRFYQLILQQDMLGGWTLLRESGYQGSAGALKRDHYSDYERAMSQLLILRDKQLQSGYKIMFIQGDEE
jgi:predicted DNA-binding WGR domain protein